MEKIKIENLFNLEETIAKDIFKGCEFPWEVLPKIKEYIIELGNSLDKEKFVGTGFFIKLNCARITLPNI